MERCCSRERVEYWQLRTLESQLNTSCNFWEATLHRSFTFLHVFWAEASVAFVLDYLFKDACTVSSLGRLRKDLQLGHRIGVFPEQNNKDNISPWGKSWAALLAPLHNTKVLLNSGFLSCDTHPLCSEHSQASPLWDWCTRKPMKRWSSGHLLLCSVSSKDLCL